MTQDQDSLYRLVTTENSVWLFNMSDKVYVRTARDNPMGPNQIPYTDEWEPFLELEELGVDPERVLLVHRPVPWGTGALRKTGIILEDTTFSTNN